MDHHIRSLQDQLEHLIVPSSSSTGASSTFDATSSATSSHSSSHPAENRPATALEIDNENLTEQVRHLTNKIASLEEALEDYQAQAEKDEEAAKARLERSKEHEERLKRDVREARGQTDEVAKLESGARIRISELEEALKEGSIALENARAELEETRTELAVRILALFISYFLFFFTLFTGQVNFCSSHLNTTVSHSAAIRGAAR